MCNNVIQQFFLEMPSKNRKIEGQTRVKGQGWNEVSGVALSNIFSEQRDTNDITR